MKLHCLTSISNLITIAFLLTIVSAGEFYIPCTSDQTCARDLTNFYRCDFGICKNDTLIQLSLRSLFGIVLLVIVVSFASAGGIGGGAVLSAVYIFIFGFSIGDSIPLSHAAIFSGALMNFLAILNKRHPKNNNKLVVDFELASIILPLMLTGSLIGVTFNKILPPIAVLIVLEGYIFIKAISFYNHARMVQAKENVERELKNSKQQTKDLNESMIEMKSTENQQLMETENQVKAAKSPAIIYRGLFEIVMMSKVPLAICLVSYLTMLLSMLLRGGRAFPSIIGIKSCSFIAWIILFSTLVVLYILAQFSYKIQVEAQPLENQETDSQRIIQSKLLAHDQNSLKQELFIEATKAGIIAGTLGLGGGVILMPVLLARGKPTEVASAVCGFVVLVTSFSTTSQFVILGAFDVPSTIVVIVGSGTGAFFGSKLINHYIRKHERPSILLWIVFTIMLISVILLPYVGIHNLMANPNVLKFGTPC